MVGGVLRVLGEFWVPVKLSGGSMEPVWGSREVLLVVLGAPVLNSVSIRYEGCSDHELECSETIW